MSTPARRHHRFLFSISAGDAGDILDRCEAENIECVIDLRAPRPGEEQSLGALEVGASSRLIYHEHLPDLVPAVRESREISRQLAWVARTALRHRTCLVTRGRASERNIATEIASLVGLRLVDLDQPAPGTEDPGVDDAAAAR